MESHKLLQVQGALQRLDQALTRLESVAQDAGAKAEGAAAAQKSLEQKLDGLARAHADLKDTSGRVAHKLDAAIDRLSVALQG